MNIKKFAVLFFLFTSGNIFANDRTIVFFAETVNDISPKVVQKISTSDNFCFSVAFNEDKYIPQNIQNLILFNKIEPVLQILTEPYFPLISSEIKISSSISFNRTFDFEQFLENYKNTHKKLFEKRKCGMYLKGSALNDDILKYFYKHNILWTTAKTEDNVSKGLFIKNGVALFVLYTDFPVNENKITQWLSEPNKQKGVLPVLLTKEHIRNEKLMLSLIKIFEKNKHIEVTLPINAAYCGYNGKTAKDNITFKTLNTVPQDSMLKLYEASKEINSQDVTSEISLILSDEFSNMCSYSIINGVINNNRQFVKLFNISYTNIFRVLNKEVPDLKALEQSVRKENINNLEENKITNECEFTKNDNGIVINAFGTFFGAFSVSQKNGFVQFAINADLSQLDYIDIYIDMNGIAYAGSQKMLKPVDGFFVPENSWEYVIRVTTENASIYKFSADTANLIKTIDIDGAVISVPSSILRGNPYNWLYQVVAVYNNEAVDFIETEKNKKNIFMTKPLQLRMFQYIQKQ